MRKILIITSLILAMMLSVCSAEQIDENRWYWLTSTDEQTTYVDKYRINYNKDYDIVECFLLVKIPAENRIELIRTFFDYKSYTCTFYEGYVYDMNNDFISEINDPKQFYIMPNTVSEEWALYISALSGRIK